MTPTQKLQQIKNWIFSWSSQHSFTRMTDDKGNQFEVDGELSLGNLVFKLLRRNGYIEKIMKLKKKSYDKQFK